MSTRPTLSATFAVEHGRCCGCVNLIWVPDEDAYIARCNECGVELGVAKADWSNAADRARLASVGFDPVGASMGDLEWLASARASLYTLGEEPK